MYALMSLAWGFGIAVSPPTVDVDVRAGSVAATSFQVRNTTAGPVEVRAYMEDLWYDEDGHAFAPVGTLDRSAGVFGSLQPERFSLAVGERRPVELQLRVPEDAEGGYYAVVFFEARAGRSLGAAMRVGSLVLLDAGNVARPVVEADSAGLQVTPLDDGQMLFELPVQLHGENHRFLTFKGVVRAVDGPREGLVGRIESLPTRFLPGQPRQIGAVFPRELSPGTYQVDGVLIADDLPPLPVTSHFRWP